MRKKYIEAARTAVQISILCGASFPAYAQPTAEGSRSSERVGVAEIVVTAQRREERLQDVPISITALDSTLLEQSSIQTTTDLSLVVPSLNFSQTAAFAQPYIRGIGTDSFAPGNEASVATYVDGVYIANMSSAVFGFNNVERIEVLRGPQGTLYGRNSTGGVVNVITRSPEQEFSFEGNVGYGKFDVLEGSAYISGGIAENLASDFAVTFREQGDGYYPNLATGGRVAQEEGIYLRSKTVFEPSERLRIEGSVDYANYRNTLANSRQPRPGSNPVIPTGGEPGVPVISFEPGKYYSNAVENLNEVEDYGASLTANLDLDSLTITSITAYRHADHNQNQDTDDTGIDAGRNMIALTYDQFSQELRIASNNAGSINWIAGVYYLWADAGFDPATIIARGNVVLEASLFSETESIAGFGQVSFDIFQNGQLTIGGRYTWDRKDYRRTIAPGQDVSESWQEPTWRVSYDHRLGDVLLYASYNRGYKSGAYNTAFGPGVPVNPEIVDAFEAGFKADLLDRRLRVNLAAFHTDYRDIQVRAQAPGNIAVTLQNAASARIYGVEAEVVARVSQEWNVQAGLAWIDAEYTDFPGAEVFSPFPDGRPGNQQEIIDASGNPLPRTPKFSGSVSVNYDHSFANDSRIYGTSMIFYSGRRYWEPSARIFDDSYFLVNGTLGYAFPGDRFAVEIWARNLLDTTYGNYFVTSNNADRFSYAPPRTFGARAKFQF